MKFDAFQGKMWRAEPHVSSVCTPASHSWSPNSNPLGIITHAQATAQDLGVGEREGVRSSGRSLGTFYLHICKENKCFAYVLYWFTLISMKIHIFLSVSLRETRASQALRKNKLFEKHICRPCIFFSAVRRTTPRRACIQFTIKFRLYSLKIMDSFSTFWVEKFRAGGPSSLEPQAQGPIWRAEPHACSALAPASNSWSTSSSQQRKKV